MSISRTTEYSDYLASPNSVQGPDIPSRPSHESFTEACLQEGLADAAGQIYDKLSFTSQAAITFERRCSSWLGFSLSKAMDKRYDDLYVARDIIARTRAALVGVQEHRLQAEADLQEVEQQIQAARTQLQDPKHLLYEPLADVLSEPDLGDSKPREYPKRPSSLGSKVVPGIVTWIRSQPWNRYLLWAALVGGEIGLIYGIAMELGDAEVTGWLLAVSLSALAVGTSWLAIPTLLREPSRPRSKRRALSWIALGLYVTTMLALGWLRYLYMRPEVARLLEASVEDPRADVVMPWYGDLFFCLLWIALPLALTATLALLETRYANRKNGVTGEEAGTPGATPVLSAPSGQELATTARAGLDLSDRQLHRAKAQAIGYLKLLRKRRTELQSRIISLKAEEAHASLAQDDAKLNESGLNDRTRLYLKSLPDMIGEGFTCYLKGLERGYNDPTMTAHIQEAADAFLQRYTETAHTKVDEYLGYLNEHRLQISAGSTRSAEANL